VSLFIHSKSLSNHWTKLRVLQPSYLLNNIIFFLASHQLHLLLFLQQLSWLGVKYLCLLNKLWTNSLQLILQPIINLNRLKLPLIQFFLSLPQMLQMCLKHLILTSKYIFFLLHDCFPLPVHLPVHLKSCLHSTPTLQNNLRYLIQLIEISHWWCWESTWQKGCMLQRWDWFSLLRFINILLIKIISVSISQTTDGIVVRNWIFYYLGL